MNNKIKYGLKNTHYAIIEDNNGVISYGTPKPIRGAVNLALNARGDKVEFYADDMEYFGTTANQGYEGSLELALIPDEFRIDVLGEERDANGVLFENADARTKNIALMFEFNGDAKKTRHINYNCAIARPNIEGETKGAQITPKTETLSITANPASDTGDVKAKVEQGQVPYNTFFDSVYIKDSAINEVDKKADTFDKNLPSDIVLTVTSSAVQNAIKDVRLNGALIAGIDLSIDELEVTIDSSVFANLAETNHTVTIALEKGNATTTVITVEDNS